MLPGAAPLGAAEAPVTLLSLSLTVCHSSIDCLLRPPSMEIRFLLGLCALCCFCGLARASSTCKLKAKFNLSGYKNVEKKKVVVGGMFPVHKRIASSDGNTSRLPVSSGCEG